MRVIAFVDGFNLYHAIRRLGDNRLKWCDICALMRFFLRPDDDLAAVRFYTACPSHLDEKIQVRYRAYTAAIAACGATVIDAHFKRKDRTLNLSAALPPPLRQLQIRCRAHEEKETDVNIALDILDSAYRGEFEKCFLVSGDSDLLPAIKMLLARFKDKRAVVLLPPGQKFYAARNLSRETPNRRLVVRDIYGRAHIAKCRLPDEVAAGGGRISSPAEYR
jgi:uncharacterized LabA/DUF88 family protein